MQKTKGSDKTLNDSSHYYLVYMHKMIYYNQINPPKIVLQRLSKHKSLGNRKRQPKRGLLDSVGKLGWNSQSSRDGS